MSSALQKTIEIIFNGTDNVSRTVNSIGGSMDELGSGLQDIASPFEDLVAGAALLETAILGITAAGITARANLQSESVKMADALGLPTAEAEEFEEVAKRVYSVGFGGTLEESFAAVTLASQKFSDETSQGIEEIVINAAKLSETFGIEMSVSLSGVNTLMDNFGLTSKEAFDFIAAGYQKGLDGSGDFIESITEYSTQFSNGGADAAQFFSVLESGYQEGVLGTDKAADAFKEFRVRIVDGSSAVSDALKQLGLDDTFIESISSGKTSSIEAFTAIIAKLNEVEDESILMQAGVGLLGDKFEDLGTKGALGISTISTSVDELNGKIDAIDPTDALSVKFTSMVNTIVLTITDDAVWQGVENELGETFDGFKEDFVKAWGDIDDSSFDELLGTFEDLMGAISDMFAGADFDLTSAEGIKVAIENVLDTVKSINEISTGVIKFISPIVSAVSELITQFNALDPETKQLAGSVAAFGAGLGVVGSALAAGGAFLGGISLAVQALGTGGLLYTAITGILAVLTGPLGLAAALGAVGAAAVGFSMSGATEEIEETRKAIEAEIETIEALNAKIDELPDEATTVEIFAAMEIGDYEEAERLLDEKIAAGKQLEIKAQVEQEEFDDFWDDLVELGDLDPAEIDVIANTDSVEEAQGVVDKLSEERVAEITLKASTEQATETITLWTESQGVIEIEVPVSTSGLDETKKELEEIPTEKQLEIILKGEIDKDLAQIESDAKTIQTALEWEAKVDIAEFESATQQIQATYDSINNTITSTGQTISSGLDVLSGASQGDFLTKWEALETINQEQEYREESMAMQKELNEAQVAYMDARTKALESGDMEIKFSTDGLEPSIEAFMIEIVKKLQGWANENASDFLLGMV